MGVLVENDAVILIQVLVKRYYYQLLRYVFLIVAESVQSWWIFSHLND